MPSLSAVVGAFQTPYSPCVNQQSLEEMIFAATTGALNDAGLTIDAIDAVVLSVSDQASGRIIESMVTNGPSGGVDRDVTTLASSSEHALCYANLRILAGQSQRILVVAWGKPSEGVDPTHAEILAAEPFLLRPLGMRAVVAAGLQASQYISRYPIEPNAGTQLRESRARASERAYGLPEGYFDDETSKDFIAWPLTEADLPRRCDLAAAVVLVHPDAVTPDQTPAWVTGIGWATDGYEIADRDLCELTSLRTATATALGDRSIEDFDVIEMTEISTIGSFIAAEALGLETAGNGSRIVSRTAPALNPSGGNLMINPGNAGGFMRMLQAAQQIRGKAGPVQIHPTPGTAVGVGSHGFAAQGSAVMTFSATRDNRNEV
jgi:acetyl-CoA C-acetyltransferase